jgi:pyruvate dehydrogenase E2 component (dihydrolipoamide acetyltransferase)
MPSLGADMTTATVLEWLVKPGDAVHRGDIVAVVDTDKAAMDIEAFSDGVVDRLLVQPGTAVPVGAPIAVLTSALDEAAPAASAPAAPPAPPVTPAAPVSPPVRHLAHQLGVDLRDLSGTGVGGAITRADVRAAAETAAPAPAAPVAVPAPAAARVKVTPMARRLAGELGVDLATVHGTGTGGAISAADVRSAMPTPPRRPGAVTAPGRRSADRTRTMRRSADRTRTMRGAIAALMARSKREIPHYYVSSTIDLAAAIAQLAEFNASRPVGERIVPAAVLLKAAATAARRVPEINGFWTEDGFVRADHVHLGVAVALRGGGLVAPAIHDADELDVPALMAALRDLVARARGGRLRRSEMTDGTLTVTNLGDRGADAVHGVIYPPQVALVGLGRVVERPWAVNGMLTVRPVVTATLAADHRATDGHLGARYLTTIEQLIQRPEDLWTGNAHSTP